MSAKTQNGAQAEAEAAVESFVARRRSAGMERRTSTIVNTCEHLKRSSSKICL
jgi:hypothetical protein